MNNIQFDQDIHKRISPRQTQIAQLAAQGMGIKETASVLKISCSTVQNYRRILFEKLRCSTMVEAVSILTKAGII